MRMLGECAQCGGKVVLKWRDRFSRHAECTQCGLVNPRLRDEFDIEELAKITRYVFEVLTKRYNVDVLSFRMFNAVEFAYGKPLPRWFWEKYGLEVLNRAGLTVNGEGFIARAR